MSKDYLVVDGYNIIFAWPQLKAFRERRLEHARDKLIDLLINYSALSGESVYLVFDAHLVKRNTEHQELIDGVRVIYTQEGETADSLIERLVGELLKTGTVYVATSDWAEQSFVFGRGAYRLTPKELSEKISHLDSSWKQQYDKTKPVDSYLENRLMEDVRRALETMRRNKK